MTLAQPMVRFWGRTICLATNEEHYFSNSIRATSGTEMTQFAFNLTKVVKYSPVILQRLHAVPAGHKKGCSVRSKKDEKVHR